MKKIILTLTILCATNFLNAQTVGVRPTMFNAGVGFSSWGVPVYLGLDFGVHPDITIGGEVSFRSFNERFGPNRYNHSVIGLSGNFNYHFDRVLKLPSPWNIYAGLNVGFYMWNSPKNYNGNYNSGLGLGAQLGVRYFFNDRVGINLELGGGNAFSGGKIGLTFKI
jgi:outer membrane immunogenic protein